MANALRKRAKNECNWRIVVVKSWTRWQADAEAASSVNGLSIHNCRLVVDTTDARHCSIIRTHAVIHLTAYNIKHRHDDVIKTQH